MSSNDVRDALMGIDASLKELLAFVREVRAEENARREENERPKCGYCGQKHAGSFDEHLKTCAGYPERYRSAAKSACSAFAPSLIGPNICTHCIFLRKDHADAPASEG